MNRLPPTGPDAGSGAAAGAGARTGRARLLTVLSVAVGLGVLVLGVVVVAARWDEVSTALATIGWGPATACLLLTTAGVVATGECWRVWLRALGGTGPTTSTAHRVFYVTQAGKYVPGSLWPVLAQAVLAARYGVPRPAMVGAATLFLLLHTVTGAVVGAVGVGATLASQWGWLVVPVVVGGVVVLLPPVLGRLLHALARWRPALATASPGWAATGRAVALMLLAWVCYGTATWLLLRPLGAGVDALPLAVGGYALAWVVGFLTFAAPAGVGAREAVLVAALGPLVGVSAALSVALVSRVALTVADLGLAAASTGVLRHGVPAPRTRTGPDPDGSQPAQRGSSPDATAS
ncbi:lysylphosphatidylglycerol synthase domain-containing protein [Aquipuribacter sp. MA13-6]|uniref:lysylphosphatidylglycerol synthase domain-containing protein n=1 Tax=unclassified Aquipuribacter TaxID=2635084 RepID=UPI003EEA2B5A